ncbi:hypothetical protein [Helicobacter aurati]|uniref:hypothetical protein n=1 Tax=Helicobacter aurati TaxID=137778 RepID=UPI0013157E8D|nr:hypothetical protein [Helicobacter aurati]
MFHPFALAHNLISITKPTWANNRVFEIRALNKQRIFMMGISAELMRPKLRFGISCTND